MPQEEMAPGKTPESAASNQAMSLAESLENALNNQESAALETAPEPTTPDEGKVAEEPEHIKWAKSYQGLYDTEKGEFALERVIKQAYEAHKQSQDGAQKITALTQVLQHPTLKTALQQLLAGQAAAPPQPDGKPEKTDEDKSDEEVLNEHVKKLIQGELAPVAKVLPLVNLLFSNHIESIKELVYKDLIDEFGISEETDLQTGKPVPIYDTIVNDVVTQLSHSAAQANTDIHGLIQYIVLTGGRTGLHNLFASTAKSILFPKFKQRTEEVKKTQEKIEIDAKKRSRLTQKGTPSTSIKSVPKEIQSFADAAELAEEELAKEGQVFH